MAFSFYCYAENNYSQAEWKHQKIEPTMYSTKLCFNKFCPMTVDDWTIISALKVIAAWCAHYAASNGVNWNIRKTGQKVMKIHQCVPRPDLTQQQMFTEKPWWCSSMTNPLSKSVNYAHLTVISEIMIRISSNSVLNCWVADRATYALFLFYLYNSKKWGNCYMKSPLTFFKFMSLQNFLKFQYSEELCIIMHTPAKHFLVCMIKDCIK